MRPSRVKARLTSILVAAGTLTFSKASRPVGSCLVLSPPYRGVRNGLPGSLVLQHTVTLASLAVSSVSGIVQTLALSSMIVKDL